MSTDQHGGLKVSARIEALERVVPDEVREAMRSFLLGVQVFAEKNDNIVSAWRIRLEEQLEGATSSDPETVSRAKQTIALLKREFEWLEIRPRVYNYLLRMWLGTIFAIFVTYVLVGEGTLLGECASSGTGDPSLVGDLCKATYGHLVGYIAFRYAIFGVLLGTALLGSFNIARARFAAFDNEDTLLSKPVLRGIVAIAIAYVLSHFVASGKLGVNMLGFEISQDFHSSWDCPRKEGDHCGSPPKGFEGTDKPTEKEEAGATYCCFELRQAGFRDAAALFAIGISAAIATEVYLRRILEALRGAAESTFRDP